MNEIPLPQDAINVLKATSRTFFIPITLLPAGLREAVASAYLSLRAIDEIEDHPTLDGSTKAKLLHAVSDTLQGKTNSQQEEAFLVTDKAYEHILPEVTIRIGEWIQMAPEVIAPRIWDATAAMADRMAQWVLGGWKVATERDLDRYTFSVAGAVGLLLSDLWAWYDGTKANRIHAVGFGRGLQAVNILRNRADDLERGVDFFPDGWNEQDMHQYARRNLSQADAYIEALPAGSICHCCQIPLALAHATLDALARGERKLTRPMVLQILEKVERKRIQ